MKKLAGRLLTHLRRAINELASSLEATDRNENELQECITRNPILFGPDYVRLLPKHRLGAEYEMDYGLQRVSGLVDLVEIESSVLRIFTKVGNPSKDLIHAEQQVLDWLAWLEENSAYARRSIPGLMRPQAYVVIGRSKDLTTKDRSRLNHRNTIFRGSLHILTYDDLLDQAKNLLMVLHGSNETPSKRA